jgi:hypothetical protein
MALGGKKKAAEETEVNSDSDQSQSPKSASSSNSPSAKKHALVDYEYDSDEEEETQVDQNDENLEPLAKRPATEANTHLKEVAAPTAAAQVSVKSQVEESGEGSEKDKNSVSGSGDSMTVDEVTDKAGDVTADGVVNKSSEHEVVQEDSSPVDTECCAPETVNNINSGQNEAGMNEVTIERLFVWVNNSVCILRHQINRCEYSKPGRGKHRSNYT